MIKRIYVNKTNSNKRLEVKEYDANHFYVLPFMTFSNGVVNKLGDGFFHRWSKKNLSLLLEDYEELI